MSGSEIARQTGFSKPSVNDFLRAFKKCEDLNYPLPAGITNYGNALKVYVKILKYKLITYLQFQHKLQEKKCR